MDKAHIDGGNIVVTSWNTEHVIPISVLEAITSMEWSARRHIDDAMMFWNLSKTHDEVRWAKAGELVGEDLTGWSGLYYERNYEDSCWSGLPLLSTFKLVKSEYHEQDRGYFAAIDVFGEEHNWSFDSNESILLLKVSAEDYATRYARDKEEKEQNDRQEAQYEAEWQAQQAKEAAEKNK